MAEALDMSGTERDTPRAAQMSVFVVRAFVRMREVLTDTRELSRKLHAPERGLKARLDGHDAANADVLRRMPDMIVPAPAPEPPRKQVGFQAGERRAKYRTKRARR